MGQYSRCQTLYPGRKSHQEVAQNMARILVVDDQVVIRQITREMLVHLGHEVVVAEDGAEAVEIYRAEPADAVLMDVGLGVGPNGLEAAQEIARIDPSARVAMLTGDKHRGVVGAAARVGARDYILKPFSIEDLREALDRLLA